MRLEILQAHGQSSFSKEPGYDGIQLFSRRSFLKWSGSAAVAATSTTRAESRLQRKATASRTGERSLSVAGKRVSIKTDALEAVFDSGRLSRLNNLETGESYIQAVPSNRGTLQLIYPNQETVEVGESDLGETTVRQVSAFRAEVRYQGYNGDGVVSISICPETGDILVEPSGYSSRPGVRSCRWNIRGIEQSVKLVAPFFQGVQLPFEDPLIRDSHWTWPMNWEAGLIILQGKSGGFWVHCRDDRYRYKGVRIGDPDLSNSLGFDTEAYGPIGQNIAAGGLVWRINTFTGSWERPAKIYRDWLWKAYGLDTAEARREEWIHEVNLAVSWCPGEPDILEALSDRVDPARVLIHFPNWRKDPYDENYPEYNASPKAKEFLSRGQAMGFRIMPHFNSIDMDPIHPVYQRVRDFQYRTIEKKDLWGWSWFDGRSMGVPESNDARLRFRANKVMVKIHPGLSTWRSILCQAMQEASRRLSLESVFIDVTLTTGNLHNCLVEGVTSSEGMNKLIHQVANLDTGLVVGGEGLNEATFQALSFAQAHLFRSWHDSIEGLERTGGTPLNNLLFGRLCRTFGYSRLGGKNETEVLRARVHDQLRAIPTITINSAQEILEPNPAVSDILKRAAG